MRRTVAMLALAASAVWCAPVGWAGVVQGLEGGRIVLSHDANTLGQDPLIPHSANETQFAVNVAQWLTQGRGNRLLMIEPRVAPEWHNYRMDVRTALIDAGFVTTYTTRTDWTSAELASYDAIFTGTVHGTPESFFNPDVLASFVESGGGVYLFAGYGPSVLQEAQILNSFVARYGLAFDTNPAPGVAGGNSVRGVPIESPHPIFAGVDTLHSRNGTFITDLETNPNAQLLVSTVALTPDLVPTETFGGVYGVISNIPSPGAIVLAGLGLLMVAGRRR